MKRMIAFTLIALLLFTAACQPTPESPIVIGRDTERILQETQVTNGQPANPADETLSERYTIPETFSEVWSLYEDACIIIIDANISVPPVQKIPVVRVAAADFSQEIVSSLFQNLCSSYTMYEDNGVLTKAQIESLIITYQMLMEKSEDAGISQRYEAKIDELTKSYENAPVTAEPLQSNGFLRAIDVTSNDAPQQVLYSYTGLDAYSINPAASFRVMNNTTLNEPIINPDGTGMSVHRRAYIDFYSERDKNYMIDHTVQVNDVSHIPELAKGKLHITPLQAKRQAELLLSGSDMAVTDVFIATEINFEVGTDASASLGATMVYWLKCSRQVSGMSLMSAYGSTQVSDDDFSPSWEYESLDVLIDDAGVVRFSWISPYTVTEMLQADIEILAFDQTIKMAKTMLPIVYAQHIARLESNITIDHIALELQRIIEKTPLNMACWFPYGIFMARQRLLAQMEQATSFPETVTICLIYCFPLTQSTAASLTLTGGIEHEMCDCFYYSCIIIVHYRLPTYAGEPNCHWQG